MAIVKEKETSKEQSESAAVRRSVAGSSAAESRKPKEQSENNVVRLFRETRAELRKVVWPSREETTRLTVVVVAISVVIGLILFVGDSIFLSLYTLLVNLVSGV